MAGRTIMYCPPDSDSEDDYDGFTFGDDFVKKDKQIWNANPEHDLYMYLMTGDCEAVKQQVDEMKWDIERPIRGQYTLLIHACLEAEDKIVRYLVLDKQADVKNCIEMQSPLMFACKSTKDPTRTEIIVKLLLEHDALPNEQNRYGITPFMFACQSGLCGVLHVLRPHVNDINHVDNFGCTPLFHAIESNRQDVVELLVEWGADIKKPNYKGYTPINVAEFHGFADIINWLPKGCGDNNDDDDDHDGHGKYMMPTQYIGYNTLRDYIPQIFLKSDCPEYFQEIYSILLCNNMEMCGEYFAKAKTSLYEFLTMNDERLSAVGIEMHILRSKLMKIILDYHLNHWSKQSIATVDKSKKEDFYKILMITANHIQNMIIISSTLRFVKEQLEIGKFGTIQLVHVEAVKYHLEKYRKTLKEQRRIVKYLASFSPPKNPLYIDYDEILAERKRSKLKRLFTFSTIIVGISAFVCLKVKKIF